MTNDDQNFRRETDMCPFDRNSQKLEFDPAFKFETDRTLPNRVLREEASII
jgi:hypothetical protein